MAPNPPHEPDPYVAVRPEFVLKVDGARPILYPLDVADSHIYFLQPVEGLALSMLSGVRRLSVARNLYSRAFPEQPAGTFDALLRRVDDAVRRASPTGSIGADGVMETSPDPIRDGVSYDPRHFVVGTTEFSAQRQDERTRYRLETPIHIYPVFTHRCVTSCLYCYAERPAVREMPAERWRDVLDEMVELGIRLASPDNGDTPARRDGLHLLEMLVQRGILFLLSTKVPLTAGQIDRLMDAGFDDPIRGRIHRPVQLSIDAVDDDVSRRLLGTARPLTAAHRRTFGDFLRRGVVPRVKAVVTGLNADQIVPLVRTYHELGARHFAFVPYQRSHYRHRDELALTAEQFDDVRRQLDAVRERYPDIRLDENLTRRTADSGRPADGRPAGGRPPAGCGGGWSALGIAADGSAFLCEQMVLAEPYLVGDARTQSLREIWDSRRLHDFIFPTRERFAGTPCMGCPSFQECMWLHGRCYRDAFFTRGSIYAPPPSCRRAGAGELVTA